MNPPKTQSWLVARLHLVFLQHGRQNLNGLGENPGPANSLAM